MKKSENSGKRNRKTIISISFVYIFASVSLLISLSSAIMYLIGNGVFELLNTIATIISVALSVVAMITSCISEKRTSETLNEIKDSNQILSDYICDKIKDFNFGEKNANAIIKHDLPS